MLLSIAANRDSTPPTLPLCYEHAHDLLSLSRRYLTIPHDEKQKGLNCYFYAEGISMSQNDLILLNQLLDQRLAAAAPSSDASEFFELFSAEQALKDEDLSYEELATGLVDSGGDGGIDGFFLFINGTLFNEDLDLKAFKKSVEIKVVLLQAKVGSGFGEDAMDRFANATRDLFDLNRDFLAPL